MTPIHLLKYNDLKSLLKNPNVNEDKKYEFKEKIDLQNHTEIRKDFSAFANTNGGYILVGILDKTKQIKGIKEDNEFLTKINRILSNNKLDPSINYTQINKIHIPRTKPKRYVFIFEIYPSLEINKPHVSDDKIYVREHGESKPITSGRSVRNLFGTSKFHPQHIDQLKYHLDQIVESQKLNTMIFDGFYFRYLQMFLTDQKRNPSSESGFSRSIDELIDSLDKIIKIMKENEKKQKSSLNSYDIASLDDSNEKELKINELISEIDFFIKTFKKAFIV